MKLGAIPSIILLAITAYIAIPGPTNIVFMFIDSMDAQFCTSSLDILGVCDIIPQLKIAVSIIGAIGFVLTLFNILGEIMRGEFFRVKQ